MDTSTDLLNAPKEFLRLFKAGKDAAKRGNNQLAHQLFRQAIETDPYHEQVWLWLASVVDTDEDRRVCFENVLELNPNNPTARRQLNLLDQQAFNEALGRPSKRKRPARARRILRVVLLIAILAATAVLVALAAGLI